MEKKIREGKDEVWYKLGTRMEERENRGREKRDREEAAVGRGERSGRHPCFLQPLNTTVFQVIFHHGGPLISHENPTTTP